MINNSLHVRRQIMATNFQIFLVELEVSIDNMIQNIGQYVQNMNNVQAKNF